MRSFNFSKKYIEIILVGLLMTTVTVTLFLYGFDRTEEVIYFSLVSFILAIILSSIGSGCGFFSASVGCIIALLVYSMAIPLHHLAYMDYDESGVCFVTTMCGIALLGQILGYRLIGRPSFSNEVSNKNELFFGFFIFFLGLAILGLAIWATVGFSAYFDAGYAGRALLKREAGPLELGLYYSIIGYLYIAYVWMFQPSREGRFWLGFFLILFLVLFVIYVSMLGIRRPSFFIVLSFLFLYFHKVRGKVPKKVVLISLVIVFLFGTFASFRQVLSDHGAATALAYISDNFNFSWFDLSSSELGAPFRAMLHIKDYWFSEGFQWGSSYIDALINILPSSVLKYHDSLSVQYTNEFFSDTYIGIGGNMGFFPVAEAYLNFGILGVFAEFFALGVLIKHIENSVSRKPDVVHAVTYAILVPWFFFFLRTDLSSFLKSFFYSVIPVFFVYGCYSLILRTKNRHNFLVCNK